MTNYTNGFHIWRPARAGTAGGEDDPRTALPDVSYLIRRLAQMRRIGDARVR